MIQSDNIHNADQLQACFSRCGCSVKLQAMDQSGLNNAMSLFSVDKEGDKMSCAKEYCQIIDSFKERGIISNSSIQEVLD